MPCLAVGAMAGVNSLGGRGLSGTGPKAGGVNYIYRFVKDKKLLAEALILPGPTGEYNALTLPVDQLPAVMESANIAGVTGNMSQHDLDIIKVILAKRPGAVVPIFETPPADSFRDLALWGERVIYGHRR